MLDGQTKWLNIGWVADILWVADTLIAKRDGDPWRVMFVNPKKQGT